MDTKLACGDNRNADSDPDITTAPVNNMINESNKLKEEPTNITQRSVEKAPLEIIEENDIKLKERIENCRKVIETLKLELTEEKAKLQEESHSNPHASNSIPLQKSDFHDDNKYMEFLNNCSIEAFQLDSNCSRSINIDSKLHCDESLLEYEKQLQKYQNTLHIAHNEKKNQLRKQMLGKAFRLKLLEVENQCNIELLRLKQSLHCLEPLQMIINNWKTNDNESTYNFNSYELLPRYPELNTTNAMDINIFTDDEKSEWIATDDKV